ncbi:TetR/AcrR family transcriptional regulator [Paractinoplanes atraurantiacus]|uniref:DNA-binding transcriptional regulator, AcrR family n=1 Tax=Paractinoplanes atraurantiacus TaxID=1036182 RepID=A0A285KFW4_9ACTN|nr:TetR/AcrR family transcriptional regulator [Actinoplanes atraurantiacus]SNY70181.1 DNA-binding transcriptional regulator, AcrR family [Actinoplanes atraurantiacus]
MTSPLRRDARRNIERVVEAATEAFREHGLEVPLEHIAQRAGVSPGTVYNRFGGRDALIDAVMPALIEARVREAIDRALAEPDPWDGFAVYVTMLCELQATDLAAGDALGRRYPSAERLTEICNAQIGDAQTILDRAHQAGALRADFTTEDMPYLFWSSAAVARATADTAPDAWRRALALTLDGLRASAAHPLPAPPMTHDEMLAAMTALGERRQGRS